MRKEQEEIYEFEIQEDFEESDHQPSSMPENLLSEPDQNEEFDIIYSDDGVEGLLDNDEVASFEAGFMHGYLEEAEEGT